MTEAPVFYYRNGCHLCEELAAILFRSWPQQAEIMEWRDVDTRADWRASYGERVPVLILGNEEICALTLDLARITEYFGDRTNPV